MGLKLVKRKCHKFSENSNIYLGVLQKKVDKTL
jgi:hypothetical protein